MRSLRIGSAPFHSASARHSRCWESRDAGEPVLAPAVGLRARLVVRERVPRVTAGRVVLAHRAPLALGEVRSPRLPRRCAGSGLFQSYMLWGHACAPCQTSCVMRRFLLLVAVFVLGLPAVAEAKTIKIYTLRGEALTSVKRQAADGPEAAVKVLLQGITAAERKKGYGSAIPNGVTLTSVETDDEKVRGHALEQLRRRRRLLPRAGGPGRLHGDRRRLRHRGGRDPRAHVHPRRLRAAGGVRGAQAADEEAAAPTGPGGGPDQARELGYLPEDAVTGKWDYRTQQAVIAFQSWEGLERDGIVGAMTLTGSTPPAARSPMDRTAPARRSRSTAASGVVLLVEAGRVGARDPHLDRHRQQQHRPRARRPASSRSRARRDRSLVGALTRLCMPYAVYWVRRAAALTAPPTCPPAPPPTAARGCRMPEAKIVYDFVAIGTPVRVIYSVFAHGGIRAAPSPPAIVCVDDEPAVLAAVARDLRRQFGETLPDRPRRQSGAEALDALKELVTRGEQVALLVADQRMPRMCGHRVPGRGAQARAGRQARAADRLRRHRGGDPGDQRGRPRLLPAQAVGPARGAAVPGGRGPADHVGGGRGAGVRRRARDRAPLQPRLARPARLPGPQPRADALAGRRARQPRRASCCTVADVADERLPVALLEDGTVLERPTVLELAERLGVSAAPAVRALRPRDRRRRARGARGRGLRRVRGPARPCMVEREAPGGQAGTSTRIENYLGFPAGLSRLRPRAPRDRPGAPARRRAAGDPGRRRACASRARGGSSSSPAAAALERELRARRLRRLLQPARPRPGSTRFTGKGIYYGAALTEARSCRTSTS